MNTRARCILRLAALAPLLFAAWSGAAGESHGTTVFPPETITPGVPHATLELHGIISSGKNLFFSIRDPALSFSKWMAVNDRGPGFVVRGYRFVDGVDQVIVDCDGSTYTLVLKEAKVVNAVAAAPARSVAPESGSARSGLELPVAELTAAEEFRLELLNRQVQSRLAREQRAGTTRIELLPEEEGRLRLLLAQIRSRLSQEKSAKRTLNRAAE